MHSAIKDVDNWVTLTVFKMLSRHFEYGRLLHLYGKVPAQNRDVNVTEFVIDAFGCLGMYEEAAKLADKFQDTCNKTKTTPSIQAKIDKWQEAITKRAWWGEQRPFSLNPNPACQG